MSAQPVNILTVVDNLPQLLLTNILHHHHGADPEDIRETKVDDAVCRIVVSTWRYADRKVLMMETDKKKAEHSQLVIIP